MLPFKNYNLIILSNNSNLSSRFKQRIGNYLLNKLIPYIVAVVTCGYMHVRPEENTL